jgi:hypothetical protein
MYCIEEHSISLIYQKYIEIINGPSLRLWKSWLSIMHNISSELWATLFEFINETK